MRKLLRQIKNLLTYQLYSFEIIEYSKKQKILKPGDSLRIIGTVKNNGFRLGTTYMKYGVRPPFSTLLLPCIFKIIKKANPGNKEGHISIINYSLE